MDNIASVRKPIGLSDAVQAIEEMCNNRAAYAHGGVRVQPIMLELGAGNGQTVFLRYVTDMLKAHKIRHFGGLDHYFEFVTDGHFGTAQGDVCRYSFCRGIHQLLRGCCSDRHHSPRKSYHREADALFPQ